VVGFSKVSEHPVNRSQRPPVPLSAQKDWLQGSQNWKTLCFHHQQLKALGQIKRLIRGTFHGRFESKYLQNYLDEYVFRFNRRKSKRIGKKFMRMV
jgi:hypothetical protein